MNDTSIKWQLGELPASCFRVGLLILASFAVAAAQARDDWPAHGHDLGSQRHSPLTQINTENVTSLVPAWRYEMTKEGIPSRPEPPTTFNLTCMQSPQHPL